MTLLKKTKNWFFTHRYGLLAAFVDFIAGISFALLWSLGYASELSFVWGLSSWTVLGIAAACSYVTGGLLATLALLARAGVKYLLAKTVWGGRLIDAAKNGNVDEVESLLQKGADVNATVVFGQNKTALHWAAEEGHVGVVRLLLAKEDIDVNAAQTSNRDGYSCGRTALHWAAYKGHLEVVRLLLAKESINVNAAQTDAFFYTGRTALHFAAEYGHVGVVRLLLAKEGIQVNAEETFHFNCGKMALHYAAMNGHIEVVRILIEAGANINAVTRHDTKSPIVIAFENGKHDIVTLLQEHGAVLPERYLRARREERAGVLNSRESTHTASVHADVATSIRKLKVRYEKQNVVVDKKIEEISNWISNYQNSAEEEKKLAYKGFELLIEYGDFTEPRSNITLREALAYVWCGVNDEKQIIKSLKNDKLVAQDAKVSGELIEEKRKERQGIFLNHLYQVYNEYNLDEDGNTKSTHIEIAQACIAGAYNKVVETLNAGLHEDVNIRHLTPKVATLKSQGMLFTHWNSHDNAEEKKAWAERWIKKGTPDKTMLERFKMTIVEALCPQFEDFVSQEKIMRIVDALEWLPPPDGVKSYVESFAASSSSASSSRSAETEPLAAPFEPEEGKGKQAEVRTTPLTGFMLERAMRMHRKECCERYQKNLEPFAKKALPLLTMVQTEDDFQDQFVVGGNCGKDFTQLMQLQQPLLERINAYKKHLPDVLKAHTGYSFEIQKTLRAIEEQMMNKITNEFDTFAMAIKEYIENSHRNYGERFMHYCDTQSQYLDVVALDKQFHEQLPNIFKALETNDLEVLKAIHDTWLPQQTMLQSTSEFIPK